jgi:hypothetical protein
MVRLLPMCLLVLVAGCGLGDGAGSLSGTLFLRGCTEQFDYGALGAPAPYNMNPTYFVADPINSLASEEPLHPINKVTMRVQPSGNRLDEADLLFVNVANDAEVASTLGTATAVGPSTNVRASLILNQTCPRAEVQPTLEGTMTWTAFGSADATNGLQFGDRLAATFSFDIVDQRVLAIGGLGGVPLAPVASGHIAGSFDFVIRQGKAAQAF